MCGMWEHENIDFAYCVFSGSIQWNENYPQKPYFIDQLRWSTIQHSGDVCSSLTTNKWDIDRLPNQWFFNDPCYIGDSIKGIVCALRHACTGEGDEEIEGGTGL